MNYWNVTEDALRFDDCTMDYMVFGTGEEPLLLIRGLNITRLKGTSLILIDRYKLYAKRFRIYVIDRRDPVPEDVNVEMIAEDVYRGMKALGLDRVNVIGNSQGGMIAQYLTLNHPECVKKLVLNVTACEPNDVLKSKVDRWAELARAGEMTLISDEFMDQMYPEGKKPEPRKYVEFLSKNFKTHTPEEFAVLAEACLSCNTKERLNEVECPVLVMGGGKDVIMSPEASVSLAEALGTEAVIFEDLGHGAYETPEYMNKVIEFFEG